MQGGGHDRPYDSSTRLLGIPRRVCGWVRLPEEGVVEVAGVLDEPGVGGGEHHTARRPYRIRPRVVHHVHEATVGVVVNRLTAT